MADFTCAIAVRLASPNFEPVATSNVAPSPRYDRNSSDPGVRKQDDTRRGRRQ